MTKEEIHNLKVSWYSDPIWDIEETEGFEDHKEELKAYRMKCEKEWERKRVSKLEEKANTLKCSIELANYIMNLEYYIEKLEERIIKTQL